MLKFTDPTSLQKAAAKAGVRIAWPRRRNKAEGLERVAWHSRRCPDKLAVVCLHENLKPWCCYCTWGCDACGIEFQCPDCGGAFKDEADAKKVWRPRLEALLNG